MSARFNIKAAEPEAVASLQRELHMPHFIAATLVSRGIDTPEAANRFLTPSLDRDWRDPYIIPGLSEAADALEAAIRRGDHILVFGDFDLDGISATTVMTRGLREFGARVTPFIPRRFEEGYAITPAAIERLSQVKPDFLVTVDCGIACKAEVRLLQERGIEVAVTDHHEPSDLVPEGVPVADPKRDPACPSAILAGVGVALKMVQALGGRFGKPHLWRQYTDFATLGTIADLMPMRDENRALVADGLRRINQAPRPCIAALLDTSGAAGKQVTATNLSFSIIPRLNAAGRMGDAQLALDLLLTDDFEQANQQAQRLEGVNDQRRAIEAELSEIAKAQAAETYKGQRALVVAGEGWHEGVKGIVASRLVGIYGVPCILLTIDGDEARGSGRSVGRVNLFAAVESASDLLVRFGGHEAAVGITLKTKDIPAFTKALCDYLDKLPEDDFHPLIEIDTCINLDELTLETVGALKQVAPFGQENPTPCFLARDVLLTHCRAVGAEKNHFSCTLTNGRSSISGIMFHCTDIDMLMATDSVVNAAFQVEIDTWRGRKSVKAMLQSVTPARTCPALEACLEPENLSFAADLYATSDAELCEDCCESPEDIEAYEAEREKNRALWERKAQSDPDALEDAVVRAIIGDRELHKSQRVVLSSLRAGNSVLAVMATGRGKSLTFQVHAACEALAHHTASLFVYPLRALIADQAFHINEALAPFGINACTLTGESAPDERRQAFAGLTDGSVDIVLTTPEFLVCHAPEFAATGRIGFVVVDEAHHIGLSRAGHRPAYAQLGGAIAQMGSPVVLALTATSDEAVTSDIDRVLPVAGHVVDDTMRTNLHVVDQRNLRNRGDYLATLVAQGEKSVIYVSSREQSVALARNLRKRVPQMAPLIGFYNAGLSRAERTRVEELFRTGAIAVLVATSAFGEGVDIPDIRNVVLFQLPYNEIEFNQMSGRAGRDGKDARVHLLFGRSDVKHNDRVLQDMTPDHDVLAEVYRTLRTWQRKTPGEFFEMADGELAHIVSGTGCEITAASAACGIAVFRELGLIETHVAYASGEGARMVRVKEGAGRVELTDSVRYREGLGERDIFKAFYEWVIDCDCARLEQRVSGPITPQMKPLHLR